jgi:predicted permease
MFHPLRSLLNSIFKGGRFRRELEEEITFHIDQHTEDLIRSGMDPARARHQARQRFGSVERVHSRSREARGLNLFDEASRNLRFAFRNAARNPLFTITFVVTLGLCVGAGTAVFSVVDAVLWRSLPYPDSDRLALVTSYTEPDGPNIHLYNVDGRVWERVRDDAEFLERAVFSEWSTGVNLSADDAAAYVQQQRVSAGFFKIFGATPFIGREFVESEDVPGGPAVVVLSYGLWRSTFGGDPEIVGESIRLKGEPHTVVGIMPEGFPPTYPIDLWTPLRPSLSGEGGGTNYTVVVRVPREMSWVEADTRIRAIELARRSEDAPIRRLALVSMNEAQTSDMRQPLLILLGAILLMLLVGGANLAGLQLARALARRPEIATRQALGGGTGAITRQILVENLVLGLLGGLTGLAVGYLSMGGLEALVQAHFSVWQTVRMDGRTIAVAIGLTMAVTLLFGLAPALQTRGFDLRRVLVGGAGRGVVGGGSHRLRKVFLIGEVALVTALLFSAGLLVRSYFYLDRLDPGFDPAGVLTVQLSLDDSRYVEGPNIMRLNEGILSGVRDIPGVTSASMSLGLPYGRLLNMPFRVEGVELAEGEYTISNLVYVSPDFFQTLGIPLQTGRFIEESDRAGSVPVVVVNQAFAREHLSEMPATGARIHFGGSPDGLEVVGIVGNVQQSNAGWGPSEPIWNSPVAYIPVAQTEPGFLQIVHTWFHPSWLIKADRMSAGLGAEVAQVIQRVDPDLPIARITPMRELMASTLARPRFEAIFLAIVSGFALLLAAVGLYGLVANAVVERTREMGVRMALGATPWRAVGNIGIAGLRLALVGLLAGGGLSIVVAPWVSHMVWGVAPHDPITLGFVVFCLGAVAVTASFIPAARIASLQPARILREE